MWLGCLLLACSGPPPAPDPRGAGGSPAAGGTAPSTGGEGSGGLTPDLTGGSGGEPNVPVPESVLVFTKTAGFRHNSIDHGISLFEYFSDSEGFSMTQTEDAGSFTDHGLSGFDVVVFLNTTGDVLDDAQQVAFEAWFQAGGAYVGVHAAADTEYEWPFYAAMVGAQFKAHPHVQEASILVEDLAHPASSALPSPWVRTDEWYDYLENPRGSVNVLLTLDEQSYSGGTMGTDHPIAWYHEFQGGRAFYTGLGHTLDAYYEVEFQEHVWGGLAWALGRTP